jgi:hypothetical protein
MVAGRWYSTDTSPGTCVMIYLEALHELLSIVGQPGVPGELVKSAARLTDRLELCLVTVSDRSAPIPSVHLEASPGFLDFLSAARDGEWRRAVAIAKHMLVAAGPARGFESERGARPVNSDSYSEFLFN